MPSYKKFGSGPINILALHGWFCDSSVYEPLLPYLDPNIFTFLFLDLRGYGVAKDFKGEYTLDEGVRDALSLIQSQGWKDFHLVGHAMGSLVAQKIALEHTARVKSLTALSPVPASGSPKTPELLTFLEDAAVHCDKSAFECIHSLHNRRCSDYIVESMVKKWRNSSLTEARLAYLHMLCSTNFSQKAQGLSIPILALFGEQSPEEGEDLIRDTFFKWYPNLKIDSCRHSAHFLLQESPLYVATKLSKFLSPSI
jgi:pimeloyl-ACP methyl ester carboxylesterase